MNKLTIDELFKHIKKETKINMFKQTRKTEYVEARSLTYSILNKHYGLKDYVIAELFNDKGFKVKRSSVFLAINKVDMYRKTEKYLDDIYNGLYGTEEEMKKETEKEEVKDGLYRLVKDIPLNRRGEVEERVKTMIDSWSWKTGKAELNKRTLA